MRDGQSQGWAMVSIAVHESFSLQGRRKMHLPKCIHSQDPLLMQQLSYYLGASPVQLALIAGGPGISGELTGPAAVSLSKATQHVEHLRNKFAAEKPAGGYSVLGGQL